MGYEKSNEWTVNYFLSFSLDSFMVETVINFAKLYLIRKEMMTGKSNILQSILGNDDVIEYLKKSV